MNIALCISGHVRDYPSYLDNYFNNFLSQINGATGQRGNDIDIFISTWDTLFLDHPEKDIEKISYLLEDDKKLLRKYQKETDKSIESYISVLKSKSFLIEKYSEIKVNFTSQSIIGRDWNKNLKFNERHLEWSSSMFHKIKSVNELKKEYALKNNKKYDCVFRLRPDLVFPDPFDFRNTVLDSDTVNVYRGHNWYLPQMSDLMFWGSESVMDKLSDTFDFFIQNIQKGLVFEGNEHILAENAIYNNIKQNVVEMKVDRHR